MKNMVKVVAMMMAGFVMLGSAGCGKKKASVSKKEKNVGASFDMSNVDVGDTVTIGKYEWIVLEKNDEAACVITKDVVEFMSFSPKGCSFPEQDVTYPVTWEKSAVREFLNEDFIYSCFSEEEQSMILETKVVTADNPKYGTSGGKTTTDKLYILEYDEALRYFATDEARKAVAPADPEHSVYLLRTPGNEQTKVMSVTQDGSFLNRERGSDAWYNNGIRPVMWIRIAE